MPPVKDGVCAFVESTGIGALPLYSKWSCDSVHLPSTSPCDNEWPGIICFKFKIIAISLPNLALQGSIPYQFLSLTAMTRLDLSRNNFTGTIPNELESVSLLEYLDLSGNKYLQGSIPDDIGELTKLKYVFLARTQISGELPSSLGKLNKLEYLSIWKTFINGSLPSELGSLTSLKQLELSKNKLDGSIPTELSQLTNLVMLDISGNYLMGGIPVEISRMKTMVFTKNARVPVVTNVNTTNIQNVTVNVNENDSF